MTTSRKLTATAAITAMALATLLSVSPVFAHARYMSSMPGTAEILTTSPAEVDIAFTQHIQKVSGTYDIAVAHDRGASVTSGPAVVNETDRTKMSVPLQPDLTPGRYVVNWKNTSDDDGDPVTGAFAFYLNYQPNTVDLANDQALAQIGFEDVTATAAAVALTPSTAPAATPVPAGSPAAGSTAAAGGTQLPGISAATPIPTVGSTSSSSDSNTVVYVIIAAIIVIAVMGLGVWQYVGRRRS